MNNIILETYGLKKVYNLGKGNSQTVLKSINVQIKRGEFVTIMGPSGSGKSTFLYNISGMDKMTAGSVVFDGQDLSTLSEKELSNLRLTQMGFVFQQPHLLKNLSIFDNIILSAYLEKSNSRKEINETAIELMSKTGISELAYKDITQASGGQLQRVGICRALINRPKIIFGDEPTGSLNSKATNEIMELLQNINETGTTILLVTHDAKVAAKSERVLLMIDGNIVGEKYLGKLRKENQDIRKREEKLSSWLIDMGI